VDLVALRERMATRRPPEPFDGRVFTFGPRWENVLQVSFPDDDDHSEKLISIALPEPFLDDLARHPLHPALLDTALSSARDPERDDVFIPFMYRSAVVRERLPARFDSYIVRRPAADGLILADIQLIAPDGRVLARFDGFTMRHTTREHLRDIGVGPGDPARADGEGIDPDAGVRLLLDLLGMACPRYVAVRPFRDGRPQPLYPAPQASLAPAAAWTAAQVLPPEPGLAAGQAAVAAGLPAALASLPAAPVGPPPVPAGSATGTLEDRLRGIWASALGRTEIQADDDFFDLGGNSLSAIDLMKLIRDELGVELSIATLFDYPTFGALAGALRAEGA
jgi:acyl carrier protein